MEIRLACIDGLASQMNKNKQQDVACHSEWEYALFYQFNNNYFCQVPALMRTGLHVDNNISCHNKQAAVLLGLGIFQFSII